MKISKQWLQTYFDKELPLTEELVDGLTQHVFEIDGVDMVGADEVLDVKVTPNRGHDCLSYRGIAKEVSAIFKLPLKNDPLTKPVTLEPVSGMVRVEMADSALCQRYIVGYMTGVTVKPSPEWLKTALQSMGARSINNVVDATNYVMFNLGQPLHAFDATKLTKTKGVYAISVRNAKSGEALHTLDGKEYSLDDSTLVIADQNSDVAISIAGVKGGTPASITDTTTDIIIESATFDGVSVRKTSQKLKLRTDASQRFEQVLSPELAAYGMRAVTDLIEELSGGTLEGFIDVYPNDTAKTVADVSLHRSLFVTVSFINKVLGVLLTSAEVADVFVRLGFSYKEEATSFEVFIPFERLDLTIPEDLVEEVGRIIGYDAVAAIPLPPTTSTVEVNPLFHAGECVREFFTSKGFSEVFTSVFAEKGERAVSNKIDSDKPCLRSSIEVGLDEALIKNIPNKDLLGLSQIRLFEIGHVWRGGEEMVEVGIALERVKKQITLAEICEQFKVEFNVNLSVVTSAHDSVRHSDSVATCLLRDVVEKQSSTLTYSSLPVSSTIHYTTFSRYPYIVRDIAIWAPSDSEPSALIELIKKEAGTLLTRVSLFDRFEKGGRTSFAFRLVFQSSERTLETSEVDAHTYNIYAALNKLSGVEIR